MIGKVIERDTNKPSSIANLNFYVTADKKKEKLEFAGTININGDVTTATDEMRWLSAQNKRCKDPYMHCLLTWREGEHPTESQVRDAVKIALDELGLKNNQCVYALHRNTKNYHVHLAINRIDIETYKATHAGGGFTKKAIERAARRVEYEQGWASEKNAWSTYDGARPARDEADIGAPKAHVRQRVADFEHQTGEKSAQRLAQERLAGITYSTWTELHKSLAAHGMSYQKKGSGAIIMVGDVPIKASEAGKRFSLSALEKKLGKFEEAPRLVQLHLKHEHISEPLPKHARSPEWADYIAARRKHFADRKFVKEQMTAHIRRETDSLKAAQKMERDDFFGSQDWKGRRRELNAHRNRLAAKHAAERQELKDKHDHMRAILKAERPPTFPKFEEWLRARGKELAADDRSPEETIMMIIEPAAGASSSDEKPKDIRGFESRESRSGVVFFDPTNGRDAFRDAGSRISILNNSDAALLASMQLGAAKWGTITLSGSDGIKARCVELAAQHGIKIANPELQEAYHEASARRREVAKREQELTIAMLDVAPKAQFRAYHEAVGADRYKVLAARISPDGSKQGFMVNARDGAPNGFTANEIEHKMARLVSLEQNDGRNIYYTPISDDKHHLLIDDMNAVMLDKFLADGNAPNAIIESSPGNWQAVITIPKLGTELDRQVGNAIVAKLNKEYGDPKLSGAVHAHRAPGFENRKPKHEREDGTFPLVKLTETHKGVCPKTQQLAREILAELEQQERATQDRMANVTTTLPEEKSKLPVIQAYELHFKDILRIRQEHERKTGKRTDISRIDSMTAVRLRATGFTQEAIQEAIELMAPRMREAIGMSARTHDWPDYAARTASYAFGCEGTKAMERLKDHHAHWRQMEKELSKRNAELKAPQAPAKRQRDDGWER